MDTTFFDEVKGKFVNQRVMITHPDVVEKVKKKEGEKQRQFVRGYVDNENYAIDHLTHTELKIWLYLRRQFDSSNSDKSKCFGFSPAAVENQFKITKQQVRKAVSGLIEKGFIVEGADGFFHFFETPDQVTVVTKEEMEA